MAETKLAMGWAAAERELRKYTNAPITRREEQRDAEGALILTVYVD